MEGLMRRWRDYPYRNLCLADEHRVFRESLGLYKAADKADYDLGLLLSCYSDIPFSRVLSRETQE